MTSQLPPRDWTAIHWPDIGKSAPSRWIAVLPLAATEQHGPHLPVGTDVMIGEAYLARVRELLPAAAPVTFLPLQPVGISTEHIDFPATLTLSNEVALSTWTALGESVARAGLKKLVMVTSHGGNSAAMSLVAQDLRARHGMLAVTTSWSRFGVPDGLFEASELRHGIHGGAVETSIMLARYPQHVRTDAIADFHPASLRIEKDHRHLSTQRPAPFAWQAQDLHPSGAIGDATKASAEKGEALLDHGARAFCELLEDVDKFDMSALAAVPRWPAL
ncbi:creatininase family protein [Bradyrhizobium sp. ISRA443]|uniref:creatininase family protein n=1 Tax=unclassified Bradyrhizobium TaxID=2631580 RepID=UPI00247A5992|nr:MULTISPECIES: creatininase family protein [unclassified Bradyrhizobium]WGR98864.1 creatininase family protein [Bradyrhizobium sp. ISRA436]WGS05755.1 creatininase family protein [Bradyrhizobium sp. ISRA437]WGS12641.1 creatininase family protein [Bradyrhizobium sp. ISRA443]